MEHLAFLLEREVIIALAVVGAFIATAGSYLVRPGSDANPKTARFILRAGYAITWTSVGLFIVAGFATAYR
ncbi:MAG: hypothetical protein VW268_14830 [Rhodospirillaceae bacterium]